MARIFISHSSVDDAEAYALAQWLRQEGFDDYFLDFDADRGIAAGDRWMAALAGAVGRCEAVLFLVSPSWQASKFCFAEFFQAKNLGKRLFGVIVKPVALSALPEQMTAEWQVCDLTKGDAVTFAVEQPPRLPATEVAFSRTGLAALARGLARAGLAPSTFVWPPASDPARSPYPGLRALDEADAAVFFGRDVAIVRALDQIRLASERAVERHFVVMGASGAGKSSFLRAGLLPRLRRDAEHYCVLSSIRPERAAISGAQGLLACLHAGLAAAGELTSLGQVRQQLEAQGLAALLARIEAGSRNAGDGHAAAVRTVVLPIDQGEELLAADGQAEAQTCLRLLASLAQQSAPDLRVLVLTTIRSDTLPRLQANEALQLLAPAFYSLPAMPPTEFKQVVEGPARRHTETVAPLLLSPELVDRLVSDARGADALPLLALTLEWLYREYTTAEGTRIGHGEYERLGGIRGVIGKAVDRALDRPGQEPAIPADPAEQRRLLERLFPLIASVDPDTGEWKRRVATRDSILAVAPEASALVSRLVEQRLLRADTRPGDSAEAPLEIVEVAHEALLRQWDLLEHWLRAFAADLAAAEALRRASSDWERSGHDESLLVHKKGRLESAEALVKDDRFQGRFETVDAEYVAACRARERRETEEREAQLQRIAEQQTARARLQKRAALAIAVAGLGLLGLGAWIVRQTQDVSRQTSLVLAGAAEAALERRESESAVRLALLASTESWLHPAHPAAWPVLNRAAQTQTLRRRFENRGEGKPSFTADGRRVLTVPEGAKAVIHDVETGSPVGAAIPVGARFIEAAFSPDGKQVVIASADKDSRVWETQPWDVDTGRPLAAPLRHAGAAWGLVFSPDGSRMVITQDADHAQVWNTATWQPVGRRVDHENDIIGARFSPDGKTFVTYAKDNKAAVWRTETGEAVGAPMVHPSIPQWADFSADGKRVVSTALEDAAYIWDAVTGLRLATAESPVRVSHAVFSPEGGRLAVAGLNKTVWMADVDTGQYAGRSMNLDSDPAQLSYSSDGRRIAVLSSDSVVRVFDTVSGYALGPPLTGASDVSDVRFSADGKRVLARSSKAAYVWNAELGAPTGWPLLSADSNTTMQVVGDSPQVLLHTYGVSPSIVDLASGRARTLDRLQFSPAAHVSPDGNWLLSVNFTLNPNPSGTGTDLFQSTELALVDLRTGTSPLKGLAEQGFGAHAFSANGKRLAIVSRQAISLWDLQTLKKERSLPPMLEDPLAVAFSPDGQSLRVLIGRRSPSPRLIDPAAAATSGKVLDVGHPVVDALPAPGGDRLMTIGWDGEVELWDMNQGNRLARIRGRAVMAPRPAFSPDGRFILVQATGNEPLRVLAAETGEVKAEFVDQERLVGGRFSGDSRYVISWPSRGPLQVWDIASGRRASAPLLHGRPVVSAESTRDGRWLVSMDEARTVRRWAMPVLDPADHGAQRERACEGLDPAARALRIDEVRAAPLIESGRVGESLCR